MSHENPSDEQIRDLLANAHRIAIVGLSPKPHRDSNHVGRYLIGRGYEVLPVYPREERILSRKVYRRVSDIPGHVDIVTVFRRSEDLPEVVDDILAMPEPPGAVWFQYDCVHEDAARRAHESGLVVVMDRCISVDHTQLVAVTR